VSKAFTKESEDAFDAPIKRRSIDVPSPNYLTPSGEHVLREELERLRSQPVRDEVRLRELTDHLATATVVDVTTQDPTRVHFGSTVTVEAPSGTRTRYRIVGAIEAEPKRGWLSWQSPLARALLGTRIGDVVTTPRELEIIAIEDD
jgi:transcription elongation GreA/GreB family factor